MHSLKNRLFLITGASAGMGEAYAKRFAEQSAHLIAHPYSSWERGLNENTNGLIRQYK